MRASTGSSDGMKIFGRLESLAALQIGIHHFPDDGSGANNRDLHDDIVETFGVQARQAGHLRAAFDLKHADRVRLLQRGIDGGIVRRQMAEIDFFAIVLANDLQRIFQHGHHSQAEQIHFHDAHVGAIFLVPLHDHAAGHGGRLERHHGIQLPLAHHHAAGMLSEMARQILHGLAQLEKLANPRMPKVEARVAELALERVAGIPVFPRSHEGGQAIERFRIKRQRLADFACRRAPAIGDDVGGHGRAQFSVAFVDILNGALALVAAGEIEVDVRPLAALFGEKSLEEQIHSHGIDRGDAQRVADGAIGRGAAPLHQNIFLAAEANDVPDDQEIAGEIEFFDQGQFAVDLPPRALVIRAVAENHAFVRALAKKFHLRPAAGNRIVGKLVAEIVQA